MQYGIKDGLIPGYLPYAKVVQASASAANFPALLSYAIAWKETIRGESNHWWTASTVLSQDGGHGLYQLTSSWCDNWEDPRTNADYAHANFLIPSMWFFIGKGMTGEGLIRCIAAGFNEGNLAAWADHMKYGNVDIGTTNHSYAQDVLNQYLALAFGKVPT